MDWTRTYCWDGPDGEYEVECTVEVSVVDTDQLQAELAEVTAVRRPDGDDWCSWEDFQRYAPSTAHALATWAEQRGDVASWDSYEYRDAWAAYEEHCRDLWDDN